MDYKVKITSKGQITLPKEIRDQLGLAVSTYLRAQIKDDSIVLKPANEDSMVIREYTEKYDKDSPNIQKLRKITGQLPVNMTDYVRKTRDEEGNGGK